MTEGKLDNTYNGVVNAACDVIMDAFKDAADDEAVSSGMVVVASAVAARIIAVVAALSFDNSTSYRGLEFIELQLRRIRYDVITDMERHRNVGPDGDTDG